MQEVQGAGQEVGEGVQGRGWVTSGGSGSGGAFVGSGPQGAAAGDARERGGAGGQAGGGEGAGVGAGKGADEDTVEGGVEQAARGGDMEGAVSASWAEFARGEGGGGPEGGVG